MKSSDPTINKLHEEYCARSGMDVAMTFNREYLWGLWLRYRPAKSFTVDDLRRVISFLRKQVNTGWSPACLTFRNVVADPEKFEEHLSLALAANTSAASVTTPSAGALIGVPSGAAMSMPRCGARGSPLRMRWLP